MSIPGLRKNDKRISQFVTEITASLKQGKKYQTPGLGTFSSCTRQASGANPACTIAMFRASTALREFCNGGPPPDVSGPHAQIAELILNAMQTEKEVEIPRFGRLAVVDAPGKKPKIIFHGASELNKTLSKG